MDVSRPAPEMLAEIKMSRAVGHMAVAIVEGASDSRLLEKFLDDGVVIMVAQGKQGVLRTLALAQTHGVEGVLGIVDEDFEGRKVSEDPSLALLFWDERDLDLTLLKSEAFGRVLNEFGSDAKVGSLGVEAIRGHILSEAARIGCVRWLSFTNGWALNFKVEYSRFVDPGNVQIDIERAVTAIVSNSRGLSGQTFDVVSVLEATTQASVEDHCCGHDCTTLLAIALRRWVGSNSSSFASRDHVEKLLRLAFGEGDFVKLDIAADLLEWETRNPGFQVVPIHLRELIRARTSDHQVVA